MKRYMKPRIVGSVAEKILRGLSIILSLDPDEERNVSSYGKKMLKSYKACGMSHSFVTRAMPQNPRPRL